MRGLQPNPEQQRSLGERRPASGDTGGPGRQSERGSDANGDTRRAHALVSLAMLTGHPGRGAHVRGHPGHLRWHASGLHGSHADPQSEYRSKDQ